MGNEPGAWEIVADSLSETQVTKCIGGRKESKGGFCVENGLEKINTQNGLDEESLEFTYAPNRPMQNSNPRIAGDTGQTGEKAQSIENQFELDKKEDSGGGQKGTLNRNVSCKSDGELERDSEESFWKGLESDPGKLEEWTKKRKCWGSKKRKAKKDRSCASVYRRAPIIL
ncbi:hypothetical protein SLA2020_381950 [Shorea laevis]